MKPMVIHTEDGGILVEWTWKHMRFGISLEKERKESGWYMVDKSGRMESEYLPDAFLELFKD